MPRFTKKKRRKQDAHAAAGKLESWDRRWSAGGLVALLPLHARLRVACNGNPRSPVVDSTPGRLQTKPPPPLPSTHTWTSISRSRSPLRSPFCLQNATYITDCPPDTFRIPFAPPASSLFAPLHTRASTDPLLRRSVTPLGLGAGPPGLSLRPPTLPTLPTRLFFVPVCDALHDAYSVPVGEATAVRTSYGALRTAAKVRVRWWTAARRLSTVQGPVSARVSR